MPSNRSRSDTDPSDLKAPRDDTHITSIVQSAAQQERACLVMIHGPDLGRKYNLEQREISIGRSPHCDIAIVQDAVSRVHATLFVDALGVRIRDQESTNGTYVNDQKTTETYLRDGDLIKIGRAIFKFIASENVETAYHEEIYRLSTTDGLTQVHNKRHFHEELEREFNRSRRYFRPLALLLLDIDFFKHCNDQHGHRAGDFILRELAGLIRARARKVDMVARYGGEEFAVLLPENDLAQAGYFADMLRHLVANYDFSFEGKLISLTISVGAAALEPYMDTADSLIEQADACLYRAKQAGRNRVVDMHQLRLPS